MIEHVRRMQAYEQWASARVIESLRSVPSPAADASALARARGIFGHIQKARQLWLSRLGGGPRPEWQVFPDWSVDECEAQARDTDAAWESYLRTLNDESLGERVTYAALDGTPYTSTRAEIAHHVYNHSTYHRGQVAMLVKQAGGTPAATDLIAFSRTRG